MSKVSELRWISLVVVGVGLGLAGGVGAHAVAPKDPYLEGIWVGGEVLPAGDKVSGWIDRRRAEVQSRRVVLSYGDAQRELTYAELGVDLDITATMRGAARVGHDGSISDNWKMARAARRGEVEVPLVYRISVTQAETVVDRLAKEVRTEPVDARMDMKNRKKIPDVSGRALDVDAARTAILEADYSGVNGAMVHLPTVPVTAKVTVKDLVDVDVSKTLAVHETTFATFGVGVGRTVNITRAAESINGTVIMAGQVVSFNELVGARTLERGFTWAPEIQGDEMTTGIGGGTCQVSTTLFAAALYGALEVVERQSHSRPSSYAKMGMDATVVYGTVDLKIKNPFTFPIMISSSFPQPGKLRVELLGGDPAAEVTYAYGVGKSEDFMRRITVKSFLKPGTRVRRQKGSRGYDVSSVVTIKWRDGRLEERKYFSWYRPAPEVFWVAPGYDESELPPLPDHARGVEGREGDATWASSSSPL